MALNLTNQTCKVEVYGPDDEPARLICASVSGCPLDHVGSIGFDCLGAGSAVPEAGVQPPGPTSSPPSRGGVYDGSLLPQNRTAPGTPGVEPGAGNTANRGRVPPESESVEGGKDNRVAILCRAGEEGWIGGSSPEPERPSFVGSVTSGGIPAAVPDSQTLSGARKPVFSVVPTRQNNAVGGRAHPGAGPSAVPNTPTGRDSHMVVGTDDRREAFVQECVDKLNEVSMDMYLESRSSRPPPIPILGPKESCEFLEKLSVFELSPEQREFYRDAARSFGRPNRRLKHKRTHTVGVRRSGGMIRMPGDRPEPPEPDVENCFGVDDGVCGSYQPSVKAEPELQKPVPKLERPEGDDDDDDDGDSDGDWEQVVEEFETSGLGYVCGLEVFTDEGGDRVVTLTLDNLSIDIMLGDFLELLAVFDSVTPKLQARLRA